MYQLNYRYYSYEGHYQAEYNTLAEAEAAFNEKVADSDISEVVLTSNHGKNVINSMFRF